VDEQLQTLDDYLAILKRRKWQLIVPAVILAVLTAAVAVLLPASYRSSATILIEQQEIPSDLVQTTVTSFADQRIQVISRRVMTTENLGQLIERYDLYPELRRKISLNMAVEQMRDRIKLDMISADVMDPRSGRAQEATIAFSLSFENESPGQAQKVTSGLVSLFLQENIEQRQAAVTDATTFLQAEADKLGEQIATLEARLAAFKEEHGEALPEFASLNRELMARTESQLRDNIQSQQSLEQQKLYLESELAQMDATGTTDASTLRLRELEAQYAQTVSRYSTTHPDRIRLEREMATLRGMVGQTSSGELQSRLAELHTELAVLRERYAEDHPDVLRLKRSIEATRKQLAEVDPASDRLARNRAATDPASVQLRTRLDAARQDIESLKLKRVELEKELAKYEEYVKASPRIEQQYSALTRDYDNAMNKYREVRDKVLQAELAQSLETNRKGERFLLIEPPLVPEKPFKPNRPAILVLGVVLSLAGGVGHLALREMLDKGIHGARALQTIAKVPLLGVIPYIETSLDRRRRIRRRLLTIGAVLLALIGGVIVFHLFVMPLDVLWFALMRKLDLLML
jgi:uncharacterized protein involved in exopolysaccharide biosynthesis